jgi:hypothetical protein
MERDAEAGYPHEWKELKDTREYVREYIDPANGRLKTPFEVEGERYDKDMKKLQEARDTQKFTVPDSMINDWPGDRFHTTHRCFGGPCKGDKAPTAKNTQYGLGWSEANYLQTEGVQWTPENSNLPPERVQVIEPVIGKSQTTFYSQQEPPKTFKIGDMQEHRYTNQKAWAPGAWPSLQTEHLENIHEIVANHYDPESRRFKSPLELQA